MKYLCLFLAAFILSSCTASRKGAQPPASPAKDTLLAISETACETNLGNAVNASLYPFRIVNDRYLDVNDLAYFLADTSIKSLRLYSGTFSDLSPLAELSGLEELEISGNYYITDISPIGSLMNLRKLRLFNEDYDGSIEALSSLVNLRYLDLVYKDRYYRELLPLQRLEVLKLSNQFPSYLDVTYIAQLHSLKELRISPGVWEPDSIINIEQLGNLVNLEEIYISSLVEPDISWIRSLQKLKTVEFPYATINDISPLLELPNLHSVRLYSSIVNDITLLLESTSIKWISGLIVEEHDVPNSSELIRMFKERGIEFFPFTSDR